MPSSTVQTAPAPWMAPRLESLWNGATQVANRPWQPYMGPRVAGLSDLQTNALGGIQGAMMGNPTTWAGMGLLGDVIQNGDNPYVDQMSQTITSDATKAFGSQVGELNEIFSNPNSFGNARHALAANDLTQSFGRGLGQSLGALRYGAYDTGRNRQMQAAGQAQGMSNAQYQQMIQGLGAGVIPQGVQQRLYDTGYQDYQNWWNYPQQQSQFLASMYGLGGRYGSETTSTPDPSRASQIFGGGMTVLDTLGRAGLFSSSGPVNGYGTPNYLNGFTGYGGDGSYIYG